MHNHNVVVNIVVAAWFNGSALVSINEVILRRAQLSTGMDDHLWAGKPLRFENSHSAFYPQRDGK